MSDTAKHTPGDWRLEPGDPGDWSVGLGPMQPTIVAPVAGIEGEEVEICILREPLYRVDAETEYDDDGFRPSGTIEGNATLIIAAPKLLAFKLYVHGRLDAAGVTVDPDSPHKAEGCRIGGRLDELIGERDRLRAEVIAVTSRMHEAYTREPESQEEATGDSLLDRLRGIYTTPVNDGAGPLDGSMEFTRRFPTLKLNLEAADEIVRLREVNSHFLAACQRMIGYYRAGELAEFHGVMDQMVEAVAKAKAA